MTEMYNPNRNLNSRRHCTLCMASRYVWLAFCLVMYIVISTSLAAQEDLIVGELTWTNGDKSPGYIVSASDTRLNWRAQNLFRDPLDLDVSFLSQIKFGGQKLTSKTAETYVVQTINGDSLYGEVTRLDENKLSMTSSRMGDIEIELAQVATIINLKTSGSVLTGGFNLDDWDAQRGEKKYWTINDRGQLQSQRNNIHLFLKSEFPESALIEVELEWDKKLDFTFGFGVPRNSRKIESLPRLESWDDSIVLSHKNDFEPVLELSSSTKRMKLLIHWDRKSNRIVIHDEQGKTLAQADTGKSDSSIEPGIYLENKIGDLRITNMMIRTSSPGFNATRTSIQSLDEPAINGQVKSFDGSTWTVVEGNEEQKERTVSTARFCGAFLVNTPNDKPIRQTRIRFGDGMNVGGSIESIHDGTITLKTNLCSAPIGFSLPGASKLTFDFPSTDTNSETFTHKLFNAAGTIQGRLEPGSGSADDILRWRVAGAMKPVPFAQGDSRITIQEKKSIVKVADEWADTLYLLNRDTIPCRIIKIDQSNVTVESFTENKVIPHALIKAIDFRSQAIGETIEPNDTEWLVPANLKKRVETTAEKLTASKGAEFGHPWLFTAGKFEFDLAWENTYGMLECRVLVGDLESDEGGKKINIMMYGTNLFVSDTGTAGPQNKMTAVKNGSARIEFQFAGGDLIVLVDGKTAYQKPVKFSANHGRGVAFKLVDVHQQNIKCSLSNFSLKFSNSSNASLVDPSRRELLLTIPRLKKNTPPKHILCATNADMLRGELVSMDHDFVIFRSNNEDMRFPRSLVASVVWLHAEKLTRTVAKINEPDDSSNESINSEKMETVSKKLILENRQRVQVLMQGNRRMTTSLKTWKGDRLSGESKTLGQCHIPFDQIYELRFGSYAKGATDVPYADWTASLAPEPKMETGADGEPGTALVFGGESPLIGTTPISFTAKMLDNSKFTLAKNRGKIIVLDFWATWCGPCVEALPKIDRVIDSYSSDEVTLLTVNQEESIEQIKTFLESRKLDFPVALDSGEIGKQFQLHSLPMTVVINRQGEIAFVKIGGERDLEIKLKAAIDQLLIPSPSLSKIPNVESPEPRQ